MTHKLDGLHGIDLRTELQVASALPDPAAIRFVNDADAFLLGEWWAGAARGHPRVVGVTLGTGLGSAFADEGRVVRSDPRVPPGGELHRLRFRGAPVEQTISRAALLAAYGAGTNEGIDVEQIAERAGAGDLGARRVFADLGTALGQFLAALASRLPADLPGRRRLDCALLVALRRQSARRGRVGFRARHRHRRRAARGCSTPRSCATRVSSAVMAERPLDPQVESYRRELDAAGERPLHLLSVAEAREAELSEHGPASPEPVARVVDRLLPRAEGEVPVRIYLPEAVRPLPVLVYFFGGGWVLGSPEAVDPVCRRLANATPCAVVSVGYRRAPEHPFPAGLEDCYSATRWVAEHGSELGLDPVRLAVGGAERRREPRGCGRAARPRTGRASAGVPAARLPAARPPSGHGVDAGVARSRLLRARRRRLVLVPLPRPARRR